MLIKNVYFKVKNAMIPTLYTESPTLKRHLRTYTANGYDFMMVQVEKGSFLFQGDHEITFHDDFELGQYPVTQGLWEAVMGENPSRFTGSGRPVEQVSWDDIMNMKRKKKQDSFNSGFLDRLNALSEIAKHNAADGYRFGLPSEAKWAYAARGGRYGLSARNKYFGSNYLPEIGWYQDNSQGQTHPVGRKLTNTIGLYDMSGNVREWCEDIWNDTSGDTPRDGSPFYTDGKEVRRVVRGGSWDLHGYFCRVALRDWFDASDRLNYLGFRLSRYRVIL